MKVKTYFSHCGCFTAGKEYMVVEQHENELFRIKDDFGDLRSCLFKGCAHIGFNNWIIVDEKESLPASEQIKTGTMSLRDHFAGLAMQGCVDSFFRTGDDGKVLERLTHASYAIADAMLKAREG
ncbi:MAG: hypothetical protein [Caudoviricetes sp.]|nr:MAG: hypothetical protein [Caudoviricetes sp.]